MIFGFLRVSLAASRLLESEWISMCFAYVCIAKQNAIFWGLASVNRHLLTFIWKRNTKHIEKATKVTIKSVLLSRYKNNRLLALNELFKNIASSKLCKFFLLSVARNAHCLFARFPTSLFSVTKTGNEDDKPRDKIGFLTFENI